ncbi:MAG TPA: LPS assembly lipoprotein LptE [Amaricoccus sp.]|nr:LPS assembly lipoprotein LptE [Amaricoccus sp.]
MWWSRRALLAGAASALAACGFTPLYAPGAPASRMAGRVEVGVVEGGPGFALRERLTGRLGPATTPTHRLEVELRLTRTGVALTQENVTTRFDVIGTASYTLVPLAGGPPAASGVVRSITGYSAPETPGGSAFAAQAALDDAEERLALTLADAILQRLALAAGDWA